MKSIVVSVQDMARFIRDQKSVDEFRAEQERQKTKRRFQIENWDAYKRVQASMVPSANIYGQKQTQIVSRGTGEIVGKYDSRRQARKARSKQGLSTSHYLRVLSQSRQA